MKKRVLILGSTGSVGTSTLEVIRHLRSNFEIVGLSTYSNGELLGRQVKEFGCKAVCIVAKEAAFRFERNVGRRVRVFTGPEGLVGLIRHIPADDVVIAVTGSAALPALWEAIEERRGIILANKEALVMAGNLIMRRAKRNRVVIKPVDSEQSAIWQCLDGRQDSLKKIHLTASGGPFHGFDKKRLARITISDALRHPRWRMGEKISVDSATLMNKGLEVLETMSLFAVPVEMISVLIHPEAIVHSMVEFIDGVVLAQLSVTDMRIPIQYALTYPKRLACDRLLTMDFFSLGALHFSRPRIENFPCLRLALEVAEKGGSAPCVLSVANEVSVEAFLKGELDFMSIPKVIEKTLQRHRHIKEPNLKDIIFTHAWAKKEAEKIIATVNRTRKD